MAIALRHGVADEIVAMVQPADLDLVQLRSRLADALPRYAIPSHLVAVERIPTTSAGKVDYKAVASAEAASPDGLESSGAHALATDLERTVAAAFLAVLAKTTAVPVSRRQSFVEMGGHSMEQIKLARYLTKELGVPVTLRTVISHPTIQALAHAIDQITTAEAEKRPPPASPLPCLADDVTPIEQEWLDKSRVGGGGTACFNVAFLGRLTPGLVDSDRLEDAFNTVLRRHKILGSTYHAVRGPCRPRHRRRVGAHCPRAQRLDKINTWAELNRPYRLDEEQPVRVLIARDHILVTMSHVVADYTTMSVILREASSVYHGYHLPPRCGTYPDPALWADDSPADHCEFWLQRFEQPPPQPRLLRSAKQRLSYQGHSAIFQLDRGASSAILQYAASSNGVSLQQIALAAVALALDASDSDSDNPGSGQDRAARSGLDVTLGVPFMNRESAEHADTVGLFLQPLPVRIKHEWSGTSAKKGTSAAALLATVQQAVQSALAHRLPWHQLLQVLSVTPDYPDHPLFDVMVTFLEPTMVKQLNPDIPGVEPCFAWSAGAKFKLMCEFMAVSESRIILRLEYDDSYISPEEIATFQKRVARFMSGLVAGDDNTDRAESLHGFDGEPPVGCVLDENWTLGRTLAELG